jgi:regulatory protein RepA
MNLSAPRDARTRIQASAPYTNKEFLGAVFGNTDTEGHIAYTSFDISPQLATGQHWKAKLAPLGKSPRLLSTRNNYFSAAVVRAARDMDNFIRLAVLVLDDVNDGSMPLAPSYYLQTSHNNFQCGFIIVDSSESRDIGYVERAIQSLIAANLMADQSGNNAVRWVRMLGSNTKKENIDAEGEPYPCHLRDNMAPNRRYSIAQVLSAYGVHLSLSSARDLPNLAARRLPPPANLNGKAPHAPDLTTQVQTLATGSAGVHDTHVSLGLKLVNAGTNPAFVKKLLTAMTCNDGSERMEGRIADIDRCVESAVEKVKAEQLANAAQVLRSTALTLAMLKEEPLDPEIVVDQLLLMDACGFVSPGGVGKTTLAIFEGVLIILGRPLWGRCIVKPGRVVFITAEDSERIVRTRLIQICRALHLSDAELEIVADGFFIEDLSMVGGRLVAADPKTGAVQPTPLVANIIERYRDQNISLVHLDPASLLGPGEQSGNDGMSELMRAARQIAAALRAACQIVHHVAQVVARNGIQDQYAGRGGTAFADNSRGQRQLVRIAERGYEFKGKKYRIPDAISDDDMERGRVLAILVHKLSYVELDSRPIFILRSGFGFTQFECEAAAAKVEQTMVETIQAIGGFLTRELQNGRHHSINSLEKCAAEWKLPQKKVREAANMAIGQGIFVYQKDPKSGGKQQFLTVAEDVPDDLQTPV